MPFPVSLAGRFVLQREVEPRTPEQISAIIKDMLQRARATTVSASTGSIRFRAGLFRKGSLDGNILNAFRTGVITISDTDEGLSISYKLGTIQPILLFSTCTAVALTKVTISDFPWAMLLILWVFGPNYLYGRRRFRRWLEGGLYASRMA